MTPSNENTENQSRTSYVSRSLMFTAPVALACVLYQLTLTSPLDAMEDDVNLSCAIEDVEDRGGEVMQAQADPDFFDTSWLPGRGHYFVRVANNQSDDSLWNPLGKFWFTPEQLDLLGMAYTIGYQDGGETHARLVQAVLLQETIAGQLGRLGHLSAPMGKRSYGVMQVKVVAARDVLRMRPQLGSFRTDDQLITRLITDDEFNIRVASAYLKMLRKHEGSDHQALVAYNIGMHAARRVAHAAKFKYVRKVERYLAVVVPSYNDKFPDGEMIRTASM